MLRPLVALALYCLPVVTLAGAQQYEPLAAGVRAAMSADIADRAPASLQFENAEDSRKWLAEMSVRLLRRIPDRGDSPDRTQPSWPPPCLTPPFRSPRWRRYCSTR